MKDSVTITVAVPEDAADLAGIMISSWRSAFKGILPEAIIEQYTQDKRCEAMFSHILASGEGTMYFAKRNSHPMGLLYLLPETQKDARIEALLTIPDAWGNGIGAALMEESMDHAKSAGYYTLHVWPFAENHRARRFYEKWGFTFSGESRTSDALEYHYICNL